MTMPSSFRDRDQDKFQEIAGQTTVKSSSPLLISLIDKAGNTTYVGEAAVGSLGSQPVWRVSRIVSAGNLTTSLYAGSGLFDQVWDNRAGLIYG